MLLLVPFQYGGTREFINDKKLFCNLEFQLSIYLSRSKTRPKYGIDIDPNLLRNNTSLPYKIHSRLLSPNLRHRGSQPLQSLVHLFLGV
jgi:hypothetical protein